MTRMAVPSWRRSSRMVQRSMLVYKHQWMLIASGVCEPLFYLLSLGVGLGAMVPDIGAVRYAAFVAPGLLASSCMNGAYADGCFNVFFKLHYQKTYYGVLATPMGVADVAFGEGLWALARGSVYAAVFLAVVLLLGLVQGEPVLLSCWAVLAFPAAVLTAACFSAIALCTMTFLKHMEQFDVVVGLCLTPMFLFSGIFFPVSAFPWPFAWIVQVLPLYHAVEMLRQLTTGAIRPDIAFHALFLVVVGVLAFLVALRRLERALLK